MAKPKGKYQRLCPKCRGMMTSDIEFQFDCRCGNRLLVMKKPLPPLTKEQIAPSNLLEIDEDDED